MARTDRYVDGLNGDDKNGGGTEANAKKTLQAGIDIMVGGDTLYVKNSVTYNEYMNLNNATSSSLPIFVEGYGTTPGDNGMVIIDGQNLRAYGLDINYDQHSIKNITVRNTTSDAFAGSTAIDRCRFENCHAEDAGRYGFYMGTQNHFLNCSCTDAASHSFYTGAYCRIYGCSVTGPSGTGWGFWVTGLYPVIENSWVSGKGGGAYMQLGGYAKNNTFNGRGTGRGVLMSTSSQGIVFVNNIVHDVTTIGIERETNNYDGLHICKNNFVYGYGTTAYSDNWEGLSAGATDLSADDYTDIDPGLVDPDNDDCTITTSSAAYQAGYVWPGSNGDVDCGYYHVTRPTGGGGRVILTG